MKLQAQKLWILCSVPEEAHLKEGTSDQITLSLFNQIYGHNKEKKKMATVSVEIRMV